MRVPSKLYKQDSSLITDFADFNSISNINRSDNYAHVRHETYLLRIGAQ